VMPAAAARQWKRTIQAALQRRRCGSRGFTLPFETVESSIRRAGELARRM
jgi:hypothetical protein